MNRCLQYKRRELGMIDRFGRVREVQQDNIKRVSLSFKPIVLALFSTEVLKRNVLRKMLTLHNLDLVAVVSVSFGVQADNMNYVNFQLAPNEKRVFDETIPIDGLFASSTVFGSVLVVGEG